MFFLRETESDEFFELKSSTTVGRFKGDISFADDSQVSKQHCIFEIFDDVIRITDLGSTNGTFVNDTQLAAKEPQSLVPGDQIRIGRRVFSLGVLQSEASQEPETTDVDSEPSMVSSTAQIEPGSDGSDAAPAPQKGIGQEEKTLMVGCLVLCVLDILLSVNVSFSLKFSPLPNLLAHLLGYGLAFAVVRAPLLPWIQGFAKKPIALALSLFIVLAVNNQIYRFVDLSLHLNQKNRTNNLYQSCIVKKDRKRCLKMTRKCPNCLEGLKPTEIERIQQLLTKVSDL